MLDLVAQQACRAGHRLPLTGTDVRLLTALMQHAGRAQSRSRLAAQAWRCVRTPGSNLVDVGIWRLRAKVDGPFARKLIHAVRGFGYLCAEQPPVSRAAAASSR